MDGEALELRVLGPLEVLRDGHPVGLGSPKQRALLAVLLLHAPRPVPLEVLVDAIWPDDPPGDPVRSIQVYVSGLRQSLGGDVLLTEGRSYRLDVSTAATDVGRFEVLAEQARTRLSSGDHAGAATSATEALGLWRGGAWQDLRHVPDIEPAAARLDQRRVDVATARFEALLVGGRHRELIPELEELVARNPLREDARALLMLALHRSGRQSDALEVYTAGRALKVEETGLEPDPALRELHTRVLAHDPSLLVEDAELRSRRHLPAQATTLVGRREEIEDLRELLRGEGRLVCVTGPGGVGKTRLALAAAHELADEFPDGVWFVGLADVTDERLVPQALVEGLGIDEPGNDFTAALRAHLSNRRLLIVLDNMEQVIESAPLVSELLAAGPGVRLLVTSRVPLRVYGEWVRALEPLPYEHAVPLFVQRARGADHRVAVAEDDVRRVVDALDRLPLAIELVAARVAELTVDEVLAGLSSTLDLASDGPRDRTSRQRTLRGALAWSVDLLSPAEQAVFARLSVFAGGVDPDAGAAISGAGEQVVETLVRASLVARESDGRWRLLETVREFAAERLAVDVGGPAAREAHAAWFLELAESAQDGMRGPDRSRWLARLSTERANLRLAIGFLLDHAEGDRPAGTRALRMAAALSLFLYHSAPASQDTEWLVRALAAAPDAEPVLRGRAWHGLAICRGEAGRSDEALAASRESVALFRAAKQEAWLARALNTLGGLTRDAGDPAAAVPILTECTDVRRRLDDPATPVGIALENLAMAALDAGDLTLARTSVTECQALAEDAEDEALAMRVLADIALAEGKVTETAALLADTVSVLRAADHLRYRLLECLETAAALAAASGHAALAASLVAAVDSALAEDGSTLVPADQHTRQRRLADALATLDPAELAVARDQGAGWSLDAAAARALALAGEISAKH